jgi:polysaccharide pyruvyl transferase CsaB
MHIVLFDEILEQHAVRSLARALTARGHRVTTTGPVWGGHRPPTREADIERIWSSVRELSDARPDAVLNVRAASLLPEMVGHLKAAGAVTLIWLPDDPVLYHVCYRRVVDAYDTLLHCGGEALLSFYERKHGRAGFNFPFWTDQQEHPFGFDPARAPLELVFLGNCWGDVRGNRYDLLSSLPFRMRIFGKVPHDPHGIRGGYLERTEQVAQALTTARCALNIPQFFRDYRETEYDFPELADLGHFQFPSRVIQYAAVGLPILSLEPRGVPETFPELVPFKDRDELIQNAEALLGDEERLPAVAEATHARFRRSFSALARAVFLEELIRDPRRWQARSISERATDFAAVLGQDAVAEPRATAACARPTRCVSPSFKQLPSIEEQREALRGAVIESPRKWRILHIGTYVNGDTGIIAALKRALSNLGHTVLHVDINRHRHILENPPDVISGYGPVFVRLSALTRLIDRFDPQVIICNAAGLCFSPVDSEAIKQRGILLVGVTLSDPDVQSSMIDHVGAFDYHTTNSVLALQRYEQAGLRNTSLLPFGIDRSYVLAEVDLDPRLCADVICLGHATNRPERQALMSRLAQEFKVRVYGLGWELPGAKVVNGLEMLQASRAGRVHINFAKTYAGYTNVKCGVFETVGSGAVLCSNVFDEMERYFNYGSEIIGFDSDENLVEQLREILADTNQLEALRRRAFRRLTREHLYEHRWLALFERIERDVFEQPVVASPARARGLQQTLSETNPRRKKVIISGFYGARNTGDELILRAVTEGVCRALGDVQFFVASERPDAVERLHAHQAFRRGKISAVDPEVATASAVVLGGGGLWQDYNFVRAGGVKSALDGTAISLGGFAKLPLLARMYGRPFHVFGMGVGPLSHRHAKQFLRFLGEQAQSIVVRDRDSQQALEAIPDWTKPVEYVPDAVYGLELGEPRIPEIFEQFESGCRILAVNLRRWRGADECRLYENIARALEQVARRHDCALVGVPMQGGGSQDEFVLKRVFAMIRGPRPAVVLDWTEEFEELYGALRASHGLLAMRLHACLLGHRLGIPTVGIEYDPKVRLHFRDLGVEHLVLPPDASIPEFVEPLEGLLAMGGQLADGVRERVAELESAARAGLRQLAQRLAQAPLICEAPPIRAEGESGAAGSQDRPKSQRDAEFDQPFVNLRKAVVRSGSLLDPQAEVPIVFRRESARAWFHLEQSDPRRGDFAALSLPIQHEVGEGHTALLYIRSPYMRPRNAGNLAYQVLLNGNIVLEEDIADWDETNAVRILWQADRAESDLQVRVVAKRDTKPWTWGKAGRILISGVTERKCEYAGPVKVYATSPFSLTSDAHPAPGFAFAPAQSETASADAAGIGEAG